MADDVARQAKKELKRVKKLEPAHFNEMKEQALKDAKELAEEIRAEPFPSEEEMVKEHKGLVKQESLLARMLSPLKRLLGRKEELETSAVPENASTARPTPQKGKAKPRKSVSKKSVSKKKGKKNKKK